MGGPIGTVRGFIGAQIFIDQPFKLIALSLPDLKKLDSEQPIATPADLCLFDHDGGRVRDHQRDRDPLTWDDR